MKFLVFLIVAVAAVAARPPTINKFMRPGGIDRFMNVLKAVEHARIVGGEEAAPHSRPFQVGLLLTLPQGTAFCGGSLVSPQYVLTAAHCVFDGVNTISAFTVVLGAHNIYDEENTLRIQTTDAITHPDWQPLLLQNDIALIKMPVAVDLTDKIQLVTLPPRSAVGNAFVDEAATVSGWGKPEDSATAITDNLRQVTVDVITNIKCNIRYFGVIQPTHICCSGSDGKSSCNGDSGGPLTLSYEGKTVQTGVVSFGIVFGCEKGWPSVYTRVTEYLDWISETTGVKIQA